MEAHIICYVEINLSKSIATNIIVQVFKCLLDFGSNGTIVVVVTPETLRMLQSTALAFGRLISNCKERYYIDEYELLATDHNTRVTLFGAENTCVWNEVEVNDSSVKKISQTSLKQGMPSSKGSE